VKRAPGEGDARLLAPALNTAGVDILVNNAVPEPSWSLDREIAGTASTSARIVCASHAPSVAKIATALWLTSPAIGMPVRGSIGGGSGMMPEGSSIISSCVMVRPLASPIMQSAPQWPSPTRATCLQRMRRCRAVSGPLC
jgi:hypothetical protein